MRVPPMLSGLWNHLFDFFLQPSIIVVDSFSVDLINQSWRRHAQKHTRRMNRRARRGQKVEQMHGSVTAASASSESSNTVTPRLPPPWINCAERLHVTGMCALQWHTQWAHATSCLQSFPLIFLLFSFYMRAKLMRNLVHITRDPLLRS